MKSSHKIVLGVLGVLMLLGLIVGVVMYATEGTQLPGAEDPDTEPANGTDDVARWTDRNVKTNIEVKNLSSDTVTSGTIHLYDEQPDEWENQRTISSTFNSVPEYYTSYSIESDGTTTIQENPGTYYAVIEVDGDYYAFKEVDVPDGSDQFQGLTLDRYNNAPKMEKYTVHDRHSLGTKAFDLGVDSNSTSSVDLDTRNTYTPDDNTEYRLWKVVVQPGDVDPTTDSDSNGIYDEGISKAYVEISGGKDQSNAQQEVYFHPSNGIDKLGASDKAELTQKFNGLTFDSDNSMTVETGVTAVETSTADASDGDEVLTDGENVFDINFCDTAGNCNSVADVTG